MMTTTEVFALIDSLCQPLAAVPACLGDAHGRVLRQQITTADDMPPFTRSAMDGYLVREGEPAPELRLTGEVLPGGTVACPDPGCCLRVFTGSAVPDSGAVVVRQEDVTRTGDTIRMNVIPDRGHVRQRGAHALAGAVLVDFGRTVDAGLVALLAACGCARPLVSPRPRVVHIATGGELVDAGQTPAMGQIRDSNSPMLQALLCQCGAERVLHQRIDECPAALTRSLENALATGAELILVSGGASVGDHDHSRSCLRAAGFELLVDGVNNRPGKPLIFGHREGVIAFGLPGNPLSHFVCFHLFVRRALNRLTGHPPAATRRITVAGGAVLQPNPRESWWPCHIACGDGGLSAIPLPWRDSSDILALATITGLLRVPAAGLATDGLAEVLPIQSSQFFLLLP